MMELEPAALVFLERDRQTERAIGHEGFVVMMELEPAALVFLERDRESYWS